MARPHFELTRESCNERHYGLNWVIGIMFAVLTLLVGITGWAALAANRATIEVASERSKTDESRTYLKQDMTDLKLWMKQMAEKQDRMNDSLQRLIVQREGEREKKP